MISNLWFKILPKQIKARLVIPMYSPVLSVLGAGEGVTFVVEVVTGVVEVMGVH